MDLFVNFLFSSIFFMNKNLEKGRPKTLNEARPNTMIILILSLSYPIRRRKVAPIATGSRPQLLKQHIFFKGT